ncbi:hypothetical protein [Nitrosopumilus sp.]|uniref:hypothetical protein n=1 Tax=Nitrosopumilus sp. TaxID=2024843 RepID=UPI00292D2EFC|nr:hypothetical protein [Nitrosopumilus sp.]
MINNKEKITTSKMNTKTINTVLIAVAAIASISLLGMNPAYAMVSSNLSEFSEDEAKHITNLAKKVEILTEKIATLEAEDNKNNEKRIVQLQAKLDKILDELNPLGFYSHEQYYQEIAKAGSEEDPDRASLASECNCNAITWRAGFQYKLAGVTSDTKGDYVSSDQLNVPLTSTASVGFFVPDWIKPYAEAYEVPEVGGELEYTLEYQRQNGNIVHDYGNNIKSVQSLVWWNPTQWDESKEYNVHQYDRIKMVGNIESFP